jgi:predicted ArsR family transcriptional regulator
MRDRITMSQRERDRLKTLHLVQQSKCSQVAASRLLNLSTRQIRRLLRRLATDGDVGVVHRSRGRPSNSRKASTLRKQVLRIYAKDYCDYNLTFACERLSARGLDVSREPAGRLRASE